MFGGKDKRNVGARRDRMRPFDVQCSLNVPVSRNTVRVVGYARRLYNLKVCRGEVGQAVERRKSPGVLRDGR